MDRPPGEILSYVHEALKKTRGAVAAVAEIRPHERHLTYAGVGNIAASVVNIRAPEAWFRTAARWALQLRKIQEFKVTGRRTHS